MDIVAMSLGVVCEQVVPERQHGMTRELEACLKYDDANVAMMDFSKYYIIKEPCDPKEKKSTGGL